MVRPVTLEPLQLLLAVGDTPAAPSQLATDLNVSRATIHRVLAKLQDEGLVHKVGAGPKAAYRTLRSSDLSLNVDSDWVSWTMPEAAAQGVCQALELFTRLGIGQCEALSDELRFRRMRPEFCQSGSGTYDDQETFDQIDALTRRIKAGLFGHSVGASWGIFHPKVDIDVRRAYDFFVRLRHRLSWDRVPEGSIGIGHDEPLEQSGDVSVIVFSAESESGRSYNILLSPEMLASAHLGLRLYLFVLLKQFNLALTTLLSSCSYPSAVRDAPEREALLHELEVLAERLEPARAEHIENIQQAVEALAAVLPHADLSTLSRPQSGPGPHLVRKVSPSLTVADFGVDWGNLLSSNQAIGFRSGKFSVLDLSRGVYVANSHSPQTALQLARNLVEKGAARACSL